MGRVSNNCKISASAAEVVERKTRALQMRLAHATYEEIGAALGVSRQTACVYVTEELDARKRECAEAADKIRDMERDRLDRMAKAIEDKVLAGDPAAIAVSLKIAERRAKLLGLDSPQKVAWTDGQGNDKPIGVVLMPAAAEVKPE